MRTLEEPSADADPAPMYDMIELLYFAYRDFVGDADRLLEDYGFGRAHHRVLHFVARHPGLTIAELLDILAITKQSLNRVLKELVAQDFIEARAGARTAGSAACTPPPRATNSPSSWRARRPRRLAAAMRALGPDAKSDAAAFLLEMIDRQARARVLALIDAPHADARR